MLPDEEHAMTPEKHQNIVKKLKTFVNLMKKIPLTSFGKITKGILPKSKVAPIWKRICEDQMTPQFQHKMIQFYNTMDEDDDLRRRYQEALAADGNKFDMSSSKVENVLNIIDNWVP